MAFRFFNFPVYAEIRAFIHEIYKFTANFPAEEKLGLTNQLRRAAVSIGSLNETVAILDISLNLGFISQELYAIMVEKAESIVKQLSGFKKSLKGSI